MKTLSPLLPSPSRQKCVQVGDQPHSDEWRRPEGLKAGQILGFILSARLLFSLIKNL